MYDDLLLMRDILSDIASELYGELYVCNDDLVMSFGIGMFLRDTSLKFQQQGLDMTRAALNNKVLIVKILKDYSIYL